jgi:hypothetical protein
VVEAVIRAPWAVAGSVLRRGESVALGPLQGASERVGRLVDRLPDRRG